MIIPDKPDVQDPQVPTVRSDASQFSDSKSVMSQEPPPYSEASSSLLSGPPPEVVPSSSRAAPSNYPPVGHPAHPHSRSGQLLVPANTRSRTRSFENGQGPSNQVPLSKTRSHNDPRAIPQPSHNKPHPNLPDGLHQPPAAPQTAVAVRVPQRRPHSLPGPVAPPRSSSMPSPASPSNLTTEPIPPQHCNYLSERNDRSSLKGTWYLDTTLHIPEPLRPPMSKFSGTWNEMDKKSVKQREREKKKREGGGWGRKKVVDTTPPKPLANEGVMPNLMLYSKDGGVQAEVNVVSGGRDMAVIVAECQDGSIKLAVNAAEYQPMRIFARSMDGSVRVRIPTNFEGAISLTTEDGSVNISEGVKARLMTFSSTNKATRAYIGNWQAANFDSPKSTSPSSPPQDPETQDPFKAWTGPLVQLYARDGSVHISYIGEDTSSTFSKVMKTIKEGFLGTGSTDEESGHGQGGTSSSPPPTMLLPRGAAMQAYRALPASYLQAQQHLHSHSHHPPHPASHAHAYPQPGAGRPVPQAQARQNTALPGPGGPSLFQDPRDRRMHDQKTSQ